MPAVVRRDQVRDPPLELAREIRDARCLLPDELADQDQVADQLSFVGVLEAGLR